MDYFILFQYSRKTRVGEGILIYVRAAISAVALLVVIVRGFFPVVFSTIDSIALALLAVAVAPWVIDRVTKLSIPGFLEAELKEAQQTAKDAIQIARKAETKSEQLFMDSRPQPDDVNASPADLDQLAQKYIRTRSEMESGHARTARMTAIFREMVQKAESIGELWTDSSAWLSQGDPGHSFSRNSARLRISR